MHMQRGKIESCRAARFPLFASPPPLHSHAALCAVHKQPQLGSILLVPTRHLHFLRPNCGPALGRRAAKPRRPRSPPLGAAVEAGHASDAFRHACAAVALDPDHAEARRLLGYQRVGDAWAGGYAQQMLKGGFAWRPRVRLDQNRSTSRSSSRGCALRVAGGSPPNEDAREHATIERGWAVRTDHLLVTTNIDRAAGADLAVRLESLYQLWRQLFGEFAATPDELQDRLAGKQTAGYLRKPFRVTYHKQPRRVQRRPPPPTAADRGDARDLLRRPAAEPLLRRRRSGPRHDLPRGGAPVFLRIGAAGHASAWRPPPMCGPSKASRATSNRSRPQATAPSRSAAPTPARLQAARHRRIVDEYYVPLAELTALGMTDLQERPDLARLYSQSAGLASFFIDGAGGRYRDAFRELLAAIYAGRDEPDTLAKLTGRSYEELDREYLEFMKSLPVTAQIAE